MKKSILLSLAIFILFTNVSNAQGGLLKKVGKSMANELLGRPQEVDRGPEPACACKDATLIADLGGKLSIDYTEISITVTDDGRILAKSRISDEYYIIQNGVTTGPVKAGDKRLAAFDIVDESVAIDEKNPWANNKYISKTGDKFIITFGGKTYGPYGLISSFAVSKSRDKFAAIVVENLIATEDDGEKMEAEMKKAKTDQEKMDLAMKYAGQMQQKMMQGGGPASMSQKFVSNIPNMVYDPVKTMGGRLVGEIMYDDILMVTYDKVIDLQGKTLISVKPEAFGAEKLFVNTAITKYAYFNYGTLAFSDNTVLSELFGPALVKENGQVFLSYMYYSPQKNSIMQCKIAF